MKTLRTIGLAIALGALSCSGPRSSCELEVQLRWWHGRALGELPKLHLILDDRSESIPIELMEMRLEANHVIADEDFSIYQEPQRALVFEVDDGMAEVFELELPTSPKPMPWTAWRGPDFVETSGSGWWNVLHDARHDQRLEAPEGAAELRYRVSSCGIE